MDINVNADKVEKGIKIAKLVIIIIIILLIAFFIYKHVITKKNTDNFYNYLDKNYTKLEDGTYEKEANEGTKQITYRVLNDENLFSKEINEIDNYNQSNILLYYTTDGILKSELSFSGLNQNNKYSSMLIYGTYDTNKKKFECKTIKNDNFESKCDVLNKESNTFYEETQKILKKYNINLKEIKKN